MHRFLMILMMSVPVVCHADLLAINLDHSSLGASPGETVTFTGSLASQIADPLFINNAVFDFDGVTPLDLSGDATSILLDITYPLTSFQVVGPLDLFTVSVSSPFAPGPGLYTGVITLLGGVTDQDQTVLGSTDFSITVPVTAAVPEPAEWPVLLGSAALLFWRRRCHQHPSRDLRNANGSMITESHFRTGGQNDETYSRWRSSGRPRHDFHGNSGPLSNGRG
jgi:hypothetical protein